MKIYTGKSYYSFTLFCLAIADIAGKSVEVEVVTEEKKASKEFKAINMTGKFPLLETEHGHLNESLAIAKYFAHDHATLNGASAIEQAKVDQWSQYGLTTVIPNVMPILSAIFGWADVPQEAFNNANKALKEQVRAINNALTGDYLVGSTITIADVFLASTLTYAFQTVLDAGFRMAAPKASAWFERVMSHPSIVKHSGVIKACNKSVKPSTVIVPPKVKKEVVKAAPKPKEEGEEKEKKVVNPLDALPPSKMDMYNFKTLYVNHPDKANGGVDELVNQFDPEGYSLWFFHYNKYKGEGEKLYMTENLLGGFLQRFDHFRKHAFARMLIIGDEPNLEIEGVWLFRGTEIPFEMHDHPQFEYYQARKMDLKDAKDLQLVREFWGATYESKANGQNIQSIQWHK